MIHLTADDTRLLKDVQLYIEPIEIYDPAGKILGLFVPANLERAKEIHARIAAQIDWAEIERRKQSKEELEPLSLALQRIKTLEAEIDRRKAAGEKEWTHEEALTFFRSLRQQPSNSSGSGEPRALPVEARRCTTP